MRLSPAPGLPSSAPGARRPALFGVPLTVDASWLLGLGLATWTFAGAVLPRQAPGRGPGAYLATGALAAFLLLGSLALHETGHWWAARRAGLPVVGLALSIVGGGLTLGAPPRSPGVEARIALGGPLASVATAVMAALAHVVLVEAGADPLVAMVPALIAAGNLGVALFNLLPGLPLDGGRLLRAAIWWMTGDATTATHLAQRTGRVLAGALLALAVVASASGDTTAALWTAVLVLAMSRQAWPPRPDRDATPRSARPG